MDDCAIGHLTAHIHAIGRHGRSYLCYGTLRSQTCSSPDTAITDIFVTRHLSRSHLCHGTLWSQTCSSPDAALADIRVTGDYDRAHLCHGT
ncbi:unnamed protein product [Toxocara canis]|uniref:Uncharacterized protein n=1 Tax=Toxocara canis TaxID=6265 RepID=A0A183TW45_TOXCA|nr:unnamed protein product [Toxocara canis]